VINSSRSERGWRGRRRIAVLVSVVGILGTVALMSASPASAGFTQCNGKVKLKKGGNGALSFSCSTDIRAFNITSNKAIKSFTDNPAINGAPSPFLVCLTQTSLNGYGCGVQNRAISVTGSGTQADKSTGANTSCGIAQTTTPAGPGGDPPAMNSITGPPCAQVHQGQIVSQQIAFKGNPCSSNPDNPFLVFLIVGGEPIVSTFTVRGDSLDVGQSVSEPLKLKVQGCPKAKVAGAKKSTASASAGARASSGAALQPVSGLSCLGTVVPKFGKPTPDANYEFSCNQNIRTFAIVTNRLTDFFGTETEVTGAGVNSGPCVSPAPPAKQFSASECAALESSAHQCEGTIPGYGAGCSYPNRANNISSVLTYGRRLSAGNLMHGSIGLDENPCVRTGGKPALRVWVVALTEPFLQPQATTGEFLSSPFPLGVTGFGKKACAKVGGGKKNKK
jgi:hypothetical protein